jgi:hypothetical protein
MSYTLRLTREGDDKKSRIHIRLIGKKKTIHMHLPLVDFALALIQIVDPIPCKVNIELPEKPLKKKGKKKYE